MSARRVLTDRNLRILFAGQAVNMVGNTAMMIVLAIWVKNLTGSSGAAGLIFLLLGATMFLAPAVGLLVDRFARRRVLVVNDALTGAAVALLLLVHGRNGLWLIYLVTALYGLSGQVYRAARGGLLHSMVPDGALGEVNGLLNSLSQGLKIAGPLAGAGIYAACGPGVVVLADIGTFAFSVSSYLALRRVPGPAARPDRGGGPWRGMAAGFRHVLANQVIRRIVVASAVAFTGAGLIDVAMFSLVSQGLHRPAALIGVLTSIEGTGSVVAGLVTGSLMRRVGEYAVACAGFLLNGAGLAVAATATLPGAAAGAALIGVGLPMVLVAQLTVVQRHSPAGLQGRAISASEAIMTTPFTIAIAVGAAVIGAAGFRPVYAAVAAGFAVVGLALLPYLKATRPERPPDRPRAPAQAPARARTPTRTRTST